MLYKNTVAKNTLELIKKLCNEPFLENFFLGRLPGLNIFICSFYSIAIGLIAFMLLHQWHRKAQVTG